MQGKRWVFALLLCATSLYAFDERKLAPKVCGSQQQYEQEKSWESLPGCVNVSDKPCPSENVYACITYRGHAVTWDDDTGQFKGAFMAFYKAWDTGEYDDAAVAVDLIRSNMNDLVSDAKSGRAHPSKALFAAYPLINDHLIAVATLSDSYKSVAKLMDSINQHYMQIHASLGESRDNIHQAIAAGEARGLKQDLERAEKANIPAGWMVSGTRGQQPISLADLRKQVGQWQGTADQRVAKADAEFKAKWVAYDSVVKGDRVAYLEHYKKGTIVFGRGGVHITTPEQFKAATAMYICLGSDPRQLTPTWEVQGAYFQGDKQTTPYSDTGVGSTCPTRAYK